VVAIVLDPRYNMVYVKFCFSEIYDVEKAKVMTLKVEEVLGRLYDSYLNYSQNQSSGGLVSTRSIQIIDEMEEEESDDDNYGCTLIDSKFEKHLREEETAENKSELGRYLLERCEKRSNSFDILAWWKVNTEKYPILSQIARDVLAIPVSTVASESAFSTGGRVLDYSRSSLSPSMVEALICTKNWLQSETIQIAMEEALEEVKKYVNLQ